MAQFKIHSLGRANLKLAGKCNAYIVQATVFNNMNPIGTKTLAEFTARAKGIHEIWNTQIADAEIDLLIEGHRKLDSTIINVVSVKLQQVAEESGGALNWCVFSSWLGPLVAGIVAEGKYAGTILEHVQTAVCKYIIYYNYLHL